MTRQFCGSQGSQRGAVENCHGATPVDTPAGREGNICGEEFGCTLSERACATEGHHPIASRNVDSIQFSEPRKVNLLVSNTGGPSPTRGTFSILPKGSAVKSAGPYHYPGILDLLSPAAAISGARDARPVVPGHLQNIRRTYK